ncbi:uncharacterized protein LOC108674619 [Hyalella azteca]|uniref:Uncharacterized protein LOC108674619 n=1 Tax=Hyalella azteca TaxID=294128 RepID=A0A979FK25_HYAAZ|nr:uncharacterized protein LOC108674619 [Hyalella azteca]XP_047737354.1 uncharacterized protein LOC108674619 [Hyalella azteca]
MNSSSELPLADAFTSNFNSTDDIPALKGWTWGSSVLACQRVQVLADPVLLAVLMLTMVVLTLMLQLFHDLFCLYVMQAVTLPVTSSGAWAWPCSPAVQSCVCWAPRRSLCWVVLGAPLAGLPGVQSLPSARLADILATGNRFCPLR